MRKREPFALLITRPVCAFGNLFSESNSRPTEFDSNETDIMASSLWSTFGGLFSTDLLTNLGKRQGEILTRKITIDAEDFDYQIYVPADAEKTESLPVIVFLHGIRERGSGGLIPAEAASSSILKHYLKQVPAVIVFPQCRPGKYWSDTTMEKMVSGAVEQTQNEFSADVERLYLLGVSMGGYGVWHLAMQFPERFAALVSICGGSPLLTGDRFDPIAEKIGKTPAWLFHGADDNIVPVGESREIVEAIEKNQGNVKYNEYAGVGHHVWLNALGEKDLLPWLLKQNSGEFSRQTLTK